MNANVAQIIKKYRKKGILIDTSLLLLYVVGSVEQGLIGEHKRTNIFTAKDYLIVSDIIESFELKITTPCILTEVSNLLGQTRRFERECRGALRQTIGLLTEKYVSSATLTDHDAFSKFGLTDTSIAWLGRESYAVFTVDLPLYHYLANAEFSVLNYNHFRVL